MTLRPIFFGFDEEKHFKDLKAEDVLTGGLISYIRGQYNRFLHSPKEPLPNLFRPRDKTSRQFHFFIACFYGYGLNLHLGEKPYIDDEEFQIIQGHIKNAFIHGYSVRFAGLENSKNIDLKSPASIRKAYLNQFFPQESQNGKRDQLAKSAIKKIISQIQEIAEEQEFLVSAFNSGGPLANEELYGYASLLWPSLLPKRDETES